MRRPSWLFLLALLSCLAASTGRAQFNGPADSASDTVNAPHVITTDPAILYPTPRDLPLHGGDVVRVTIYGISDFNYTGRITEEGLLTVPLIAPVPLAGLTIREAQTLVAQKLQDAKMFNNPPVQIELTESLKSNIVVMGESKATLSGLAGTRKLFEVLSAAGGLPATASHVIHIDRPGAVDSINVDLGTDPERSKYANVPVFPGDTVVTSRIGNVYFLGAWKAQGSYPLQNNAPMTMLQMYAQVQGKFWEAKSNEVRLVRTVGTTRTMTIIRVDDILKGKAPDPVLQGDDIVYMPSNAFKAALRGGGFTTGLGIILTLYALVRN